METNCGKRTLVEKYLGFPTEDEPCRRYALFAPSHGRRRPGRQATSYASYIQKLLGDTDSDLKPEAIASLA